MAIRLKQSLSDALLISLKSDSTRFALATSTIPGQPSRASVIMQVDLANNKAFLKNHYKKVVALKQLSAGFGFSLIVRIQLKTETKPALITVASIMR